MDKAAAEAEVTDQALDADQDLALADLPQFIVVSGDVAKGSLGTFEVVTAVLTVEVVGSEEGRGGIVLVFDPETAKQFAGPLRSIASTLTPMEEQVRRYQDAQDLVHSPKPQQEED